MKYIISRTVNQQHRLSDAFKTHSVARYCVPALIKITLITFLIITGQCGWTQNKSANENTLRVTNRFSVYKNSVAKDSSMKMVELKTLIPRLVYDFRYASTNNFVKKAMYPADTKCTFLRYPAAIALSKVADALSGQGYGLKIWDAYRPYTVTKEFWKLIKDERYVANPAKGSGHNRGLAVDLTIIDLRTGKELDMGTPFDNFTDSAHHDFKHNKTVSDNRKLLKQTMERFGFRSLITEWWHYSWPNDRQYEVLDIPFVQLLKNR